MVKVLFWFSFILLAIPGLSQDTPDRAQILLQDHFEASATAEITEFRISKKKSIKIPSRWIQLSWNDELEQWVMEKYCDAYSASIVLSGKVIETRTGDGGGGICEILSVSATSRTSEDATIVFRVSDLISPDQAFEISIKPGEGYMSEWTWPYKTETYVDERYENHFGIVSEDCEEYYKEYSQLEESGVERLLYDMFGVIFHETPMTSFETSFGNCEWDYSKEIILECVVDNLVWQDINEDGLVDALLLNDDFPVPNDWAQTLGFEWSLSYQEWFNLLLQQGMEILVSHEPMSYLHSDEFGERMVFAAHFTAFDPSAQMAMEFYFDFGNKNSEGHDEQAPNTLYTIYFRKS
jgi:hypothetical protein